MLAALLFVTFIASGFSTSSSAAGWYLGGFDNNCQVGCELQGLICTEQGLAHHNGDVNTSAKVISLLADLDYEFEVDVASCSGEWGDNKSVPNTDPDSCNYSEDTRDMDTYSCTKEPSQDVQRQRLCYCTPEEDASEVSSTGTASEVSSTGTASDTSLFSSTGAVPTSWTDSSDSTCEGEATNDNFCDATCLITEVQEEESSVHGFDTSGASVEDGEVGSSELTGTVWYYFKVPKKTVCIDVTSTSGLSPLFALYGGPKHRKICKTDSPNYSLIKKDKNLLAESSELKCVTVSPRAHYYLQIDGDSGCGEFTITTYTKKQLKELKAASEDVPAMIESSVLNPM